MSWALALRVCQVRRHLYAQRPMRAMTPVPAHNSKMFSVAFHSGF